LKFGRIAKDLNKFLSEIKNVHGDGGLKKYWI
jgi:hypothetical protein